MNENDQQQNPEEHTAYSPITDKDGSVLRLSGMYQNWFLNYASCVILDRAVPHLGDGLKPVQRRILHTMKRMDDGRLNKVANIVGETMKFHPHGDSSIYGALVQLGQKNLLIETQGNWGNILTGDEAAAGRYIEARLSKLALDIVFNPKTTDWKLSYDGRNKEPVTLPVKFPLLLAQGAEGIAVGLSAKILPHNFGELCLAAICYLKGEEFHLYPDFQTGGRIDVSRYNDGKRGGAVKIRAKIEKLDNKTLVIREIPFGKTTGGVIESILKANKKGKIKIKNIADNTAENVEIVITLLPGTSSDKTIDALYAFTDCEISISPNCCVIDNDTPKFLTVSEVLQYSAERAKDLLRRELEIRRDEIMEQLHYATLEEIFIQERIYKDKGFENASTTDAACEHIDNRLTPYYPDMIREVTKDDILKLLEIKMARILKFNKDKAEEAILRMKQEIAAIEKDLMNMIAVTCNWFQILYDKYAANYPRLTEIASFDTIQANKVAEANQKLYINREDGFIGTALKKDEYVCNCSDIDDVLIIYRDGTYKVVHIAEKLFVGETERSKSEGKKAEILHLAVFKKGDSRTIYNVVYRDGKKGSSFMKRFNITSITRDREYDLTSGTAGSRLMYFTANPNGEAEVIKVMLKPNPKIKKLSFDLDFANLAIKGRQSRGNLVSHHPLYRVLLKSHGGSTLGGRKVWFDFDVFRINYEEHGTYLGEFRSDDRILVILKNGEFYTTDIDLNNHYETSIQYIGKYKSSTIWTAILNDVENDGYPYIKRFQLDSSARHQNCLADSGNNSFLILSSQVYPRFQVTFAKSDSFRDPEIIDADDFIKVKGFKAKGKRITTFAVGNIEELEPTRFPDPEPEAVEDDEELEEGVNDDNDTILEDPDLNKSDDELRDELTGQLRLF